MVDDQNARQQFNLVPENLEGDRPRQKRRVHKDAFSKWDIVRHRAGLTENQGICFLRRSYGLLGKVDLNISDRQPRLINHELRPALNTVCEHNRPGSFACTPTLNFSIEEGVTNHRQDKRQDEMLHRAI